MPAFIETQFPIARLSAESYKERKANNGQTLTRLGKWRDRKPLILVRASILGMLMPASSDAKKDREIFLKILTMGDAGAWERCKPASQRKTSRTGFDQLPYAERIADCERPENIDGPTPAAWAEINAHLGTHAKSLPELVEQLGHKQFGRTPRVGDSFCGGGSIPFEAARIGCEAFGSDLNPVAGLLTWASLNLLGGGKAVQEQVILVQAEALAAADQQVTADRLEATHGLFGQIPDTLEDVWVKVALNEEKAASQPIDRTAATRNPFDAKYSKVEDDDWETCASVLNRVSMKELLSKAW